MRHRHRAFLASTGQRRKWRQAITLIDASMLQTRFAGEVRDFVAEDFMDRKQARRLDRYQQFALAAAEMAMQDSGFVATEHNAERAAVIVGSCVGGLANAEDATIAARPSSPGKVSPFFILNVLINMAASHISIRLDSKVQIGPPIARVPRARTHWGKRFG